MKETEDRQCAMIANGRIMGSWLDNSLVQSVPSDVREELERENVMQRHECAHEQKTDEGMRYIPLS